MNQEESCRKCTRFHALTYSSFPYIAIQCHIVCILLVAKTCFAAKKSTGYCKWQYRNVSCYVEQGECYCDQFCVFFSDCCEDVKSEDNNSLLTRLVRACGMHYYVFVLLIIVYYIYRIFQS